MLTQLCFQGSEGPYLPPIIKGSNENCKSDHSVHNTALYEVLMMVIVDALVRKAWVLVVGMFTNFTVCAPLLCWSRYCKIAQMNVTSQIQFALGCIAF